MLIGINSNKKRDNQIFSCLVFINYCDTDSLGCSFSPELDEGVLSLEVVSEFSSLLVDEEVGSLDSDELSGCSEVDDEAGSSASDELLDGS